MEDVTEDKKLVYENRDYGYHVSDNRGNAVIILMHETSQVSYHVTAVVRGHTYSATFHTPEATHQALDKLYNHNSYTTEKSLLTDRRGGSWFARAYRWFYRYLQ